MNVQLNTENRSLAMSLINHVGWYAWGRLLNIIIKSFDTIGFNFLKNYQYHRKKWIYSIFRKIVITIEGRWTSSNLNTLFIKRATKPSWRRKHESGSKQKGLNLRRESSNWKFFNFLRDIYYISVSVFFGKSHFIARILQFLINKWIINSQDPARQWNSAFCGRNS